MPGDLFTLTDEQLIIANKINVMVDKIAAEKNLKKSLAALAPLAQKKPTKYERKTVLPEIEKNLKILAAENNKEQLIEYLKTLPLTTIITLAHNYEKFDHFCKSKKLEAYWTQLIPAQRTAEVPAMKWEVQNNANPIFNQLCSIVWCVAAFHESCDQLKDSYREKSAWLGCYIGQYAEIKVRLRQLDDNAVNERSILALALRAAQLHGIDGSVLLVATCTSLAAKYQTKFAQTGELSHQDTAAKYYRAAAIFLDYTKTLLAQRIPPIQTDHCRFFADFGRGYANLAEMADTLALINQQITARPALSAAASSA